MMMMMTTLMTTMMTMSDGALTHSAPRVYKSREGARRG
jgi:hypothetical protein